MHKIRLYIVPEDDFDQGVDRYKWSCRQSDRRNVRVDQAKSNGVAINGYVFGRRDVSQVSI